MFIKALGTSLELGSAPEKESQSRRMSLWSPLFEASHCSPYPGQEAGNSGEDCWRGPHPVSIGDNAWATLLHTRGPPESPYRQRREGTLCFPGLPTPVASSQPSERTGLRRAPSSAGVCEMGGWWGAEDKLLNFPITGLHP